MTNEKKSVQELLTSLKSPRHPALLRRDAAYASAKQHDRLTPDGKLKVNKMPLAEDLIGLRPLSKAEQVARYDGKGIDHRLVPDEKFMSEEDFLDHLDDLPESGLSPYEIAGIRNIEYSYSLGRPHQEPLEASEDDPATPLPEGVGEGPQEATPTTPDPKPKA